MERLNVKPGQVVRDCDGQIVLVATAPCTVLVPTVPWEPQELLAAEAERLASPVMEDGAGI